MKKNNKRNINIIYFFILVIFILLFLSLWNEQITKVYAYSMIENTDIIDNDLVLNKKITEIESVDYLNYTENQSEEEIYEPVSLDETKEMITYKPPVIKEKKIDEPFKLITHKVVKNENLWNIAEKYNTDLETIKSINNLHSTNKIFIGMTLKIPNMRGFLLKIKKHDTLYHISKKYDVSLKKILKVNKLTKKSILKPGKFVFLPGVNPRKYKRYSTKHLRGKMFIWPTTTTRISSSYGWRIHPLYKRKIFHQGLDIAGPVGTKIFASASGKVYYRGWIRGYGRVIAIRHKGNYETRYAHLSKFLVSLGEWVNRGEIIGYMGKTGRVTGPHLHFEIIKNGRHKNPIYYISKRRR